jgi:hypothetical protein
VNTTGAGAGIADDPWVVNMHSPVGQRDGYFYTYTCKLSLSLSLSLPLNRGKEIHKGKGAREREGGVEERGRETLNRRERQDGGKGSMRGGCLGYVMGRTNFTG